MPRQKNRGQQYFFPTYQASTRTRRWKMASYIRLSKEDLQKIKKGLDCSNSVKNQRDILNYFYETHAEEFESIREYVDDGHTGTDTDREHFQEMLSDIMSGKINCVVVKDLSRLARNYSDTGEPDRQPVCPDGRPLHFACGKCGQLSGPRTAFPILRSPSPT